jgi:molybdopterin synthase sulfur carrier subunit
MELELKFFATFRAAVGQKFLEREVPDDATVGDVLASLEAEYDGLEGKLLDDEGELLPQLSILLNGQDVVHQEGVDTRLSPDDTLAIFPPVAGGTESEG